MNITQDQNENGFKMNDNWNEKSKILKEKFPQLTESDLHFETGKENELLTRLETRLNVKREEVIGILSENEPAKN